MDLKPDFNRFLAAARHRESEDGLSLLMDDLIAMGPDVIQPIDPSCMDMGKVKKRWDDRLCLIGNVSNELLRSGSPQEVAARVKELLRDMDVVGKNFGEGMIFVPEMLVSAVTMKAGLDVVKPRLSGDQSRSRGTIIMATVKGDLHDIGKNLVTMMLEGAGFKVFDLGVDLSVEKLIDQIKAIKPDVLGLSELLTTTMPGMQNVLAGLKAQGLRDQVKVMVGGAPVDKGFA